MATKRFFFTHEDEKRHKCLKCGAVRYESFMRKATWREWTACPQFGNNAKQWICRRHGI